MRVNNTYPCRCGVRIKKNIKWCLTYTKYLEIYTHTHLFFKVLPIYLFYFPASTAKTPNTFVVVRLDIPVLNIDTLGIFLWELCLQLVGEVMKNAHTILCGLRQQNINIDHIHIGMRFAGVISQDSFGSRSYKVYWMLGHLGAWGSGKSLARKAKARSWMVMSTMLRRKGWIF